MASAGRGRRRERIWAPFSSKERQAEARPSSFRKARDRELKALSP